MMQLDWTTFILEIVNFLVLVWILQRFLYRPMLALLDARQQRISEQTERAEQLQAEAEALQSQYQARLADWQQQQEAARRALDEELAQLRSSELAALQKTLADEEAKFRVRNQAATATREAALVREAAGKAYAQTAAMLQRLASPALTSAIVDIFLEDLRQLPEPEQAALHKAAAGLITASAVEIASAHALSNAEQVGLTQTLSAASGQALSFKFATDPALIAGVRAVVGECQLHANLADELAFFRRQINHD
ncbi:F0F1 ATP synthase subunit delta [Methylomonas koyamae]|nr:F0F1 ATP synthase subunit delta [Methylomonas koyamae]ATG90608.1 F0F1 ATP synthase subunit B [Methylomonas koyamae]